MNTTTHPPQPTQRLSVEREGHSGSGVTPDSSGATVPKGQTGAGARPEHEPWFPNAALGSGRCRVSGAPASPAALAALTPPGESGVQRVWGPLTDFWEGRGLGTQGKVKKEDRIRGFCRSGLSRFRGSSNPGCPGAERWGRGTWGGRRGKHGADRIHGHSTISWVPCACWSLGQPLCTRHLSQHHR